MTTSFSEGDIGLANMDWTKSLDDVRAVIPKEDFQQWLEDNAYLPVVQRASGTKAAHDVSNQPRDGHGRWSVSLETIPSDEAFRKLGVPEEHMDKAREMQQTWANHDSNVNGRDVRIRHTADTNNNRELALRRLRPALTKLVDEYPLSHMPEKRIELILAKNMMSSDALGEHLPDEQRDKITIAIRENVSTSPMTSYDYAPPSRRVSEAKYVLTHEYGHVLEHDYPDEVAAKFMDKARSVSKYAAADPHELFAESFASWALTSESERHNLPSVVRNLAAETWAKAKSYPRTVEFKRSESGIPDVKRDVSDEARDDHGRWSTGASTYTPDHSAPKDGYFDYSSVKNRGELTQEGEPVWRQEHDALVQEALGKYKGANSDFRIHADHEIEGVDQPASGSGKIMRAQAAALLWELKNNSRPNDKPLYRGSHTPATRVEEWSEKRSVAAGWAKRGNGQVLTLPKGAGRGIRIADYIESGLDALEKGWIMQPPVAKSIVWPDTKGGPGSGDFHHGGRVGEVGGSSSSTHFDREQFDKLLSLIQKTPMHNGIWHGEDHWQHEAMTGLKLADADPRVDRGLVLMFAMIHDTHRENEYSDPDHGQRAADFARSINDSILHLPPAKLDILTKACIDHDRGMTTNNLPIGETWYADTHPTIGAMWDSDRLQLQRVGITPSPRYLSTDEAPKIIASVTADLRKDYTWDQVYAAYEKGLKSSKSAHDVSDEERDDHGRWSAGEIGGSLSRFAEEYGMGFVSSHADDINAVGPLLGAWQMGRQSEIQAIAKGLSDGSSTSEYEKSAGVTRDQVARLISMINANGPDYMTKPMWRGMSMAPEALSKLEVGSEITLPLAGFSENRDVGNTYADQSLSHDRTERVLLKMTGLSNSVSPTVHTEGWEQEKERITSGEFEVTGISKTKVGPDKFTVLSIERTGDIPLKSKKGGPGSGDHGHAGRPGEVGGSTATAAKLPNKTRDLITTNLASFSAGGGRTSVIHELVTTLDQRELNREVSKSWKRLKFSDGCAMMREAVADPSMMLKRGGDMYLAWKGSGKEKALIGAAYVRPLGRSYYIEHMGTTQEVKGTGTTLLQMIAKDHPETLTGDMVDKAVPYFKGLGFQKMVTSPNTSGGYSYTTPLSLSEDKTRALAVIMAAESKSEDPEEDSDEPYDDYIPEWDWDSDINVQTKSIKGGPGSGFHGHEGRPGHVGGSSSGGSSSIPDFQREILEDHEDSYYSRQLALAKNPPAGTILWRGEQLPADGSIAPESVGMHWTVKPEMVVVGRMGQSDLQGTGVIWQARIENPAEQTLDRGHPVWTGRHQSLNAEAEVRLRPGQQIKVEGAYVFTGSDRSKLSGGYLNVLDPSKSPDWKWVTVSKTVPINYRPTDIIDYSDVGLDPSGKDAKGGPGSGDHGHAGRPGEVGGSALQSSNWTSLGAHRYHGEADLLDQIPIDNIQAAADIIRDFPVEVALVYDKDGKEIFRHTSSSPSRVVFTYAQSAVMEGNTMLHNHPKNGPVEDISFSPIPGDVELAHRLGMAEIRVASTNYDFAMKPPIGQDKFTLAGIRPHLPELPTILQRKASEYQAQIDAGTMTIAEAEKRTLHEVYVEWSQISGYRYSRTLRLD